MLTTSQGSALGYVSEVASHTLRQSREQISEILRLSDCEPTTSDAVKTSIIRSAPIDLNFHPDRIDNSGLSVAEGLLKHGVYKNQFETQISNGGLTAYEGGDRDQWEERLFGGAYQGKGVKPEHRPKYGGLNLLGFWDGACARFGSCYLRLKPHVARRCTFS